MLTLCIENTMYWPATTGLCWCIDLFTGTCHTHLLKYIHLKENFAPSNLGFKP